MNESKIFMKYISCKCECKFGATKSNSKQKWNRNKCLCECKNPKEHQVCEKGRIWNPTTISCENGKYPGSTADNSVITCDEIIDMTKSTSIKTATTKSLYADIKKEFYSKHVYNNKFLKTKIKSYGDVAIDFHYKEICKVGYNHTCLAELGFYS